MFKCVNSNFAGSWPYMLGQEYELSNESPAYYEFKLKNDQGIAYNFLGPKECFEEVKNENDNLKDLPEDMFKNSAKSMETVEIKIEDLKLTVKRELEEYCPGDRTTPPAGGNFYAHEVLTASGEDIIDLLSKRVLDKIKQSCFDELIDN